MKTKFPRADALKVAGQLCDFLKPVCERIVVAGSIRRKCPMCSDVELLFIPKMVPGNRTDMFSDPIPINAAQDVIFKLADSKIIEPRKNKEGHYAGWGPKNKLGIHVASGIPVDLFETTKENWFVSLVVRTGPKEFNLKLTTGAQKRGLTFF
jgi:DNA polymerase/3'-5' exonuclease PolX